MIQPLLTPQPETPFRNALLAELTAAYASEVTDKMPGKPAGKAYWLDNFTTAEGFVANGMTSQGLIFDEEDESRFAVPFAFLTDQTLVDCLRMIRAGEFV